MSVEDRLLLLLIQARQTGGDDALRDAAGLRSRLSSQAPDLHGEIQAMAAALAMGAPVRIAGAADAEAERAAIAADIARQERLSMSVVTPGLAVACQGGAGIGPADASPAPPSGGEDWAGDSIVVGGDAPSAQKPGEDSWAGDSVAVGAAPSLDKGAPPPPQPVAPPPFAAPPPYPQPQPQPGPYYPPHGYGPGPYGAAAPKPFYTQTWFFVLIAAIIIAAAVGYTLWRTYGGASTGTAANAPAAPVTPPVTKGPQPVTPPQPDMTPRPGGPTLTPLESQPVRLPLQRYADGRVGIGFRVVAESGPIDGLIILPRGGWDGETTVLASNGAGARSIGTGRLILQTTDDNSPARSMQVQWQQDGVGAGATEIGFASEAGQADVVLSGAGMCIADPTSGTIIGCGQIE